MPGPYPAVSIGLVVYNGERFLPATLESILEQDFRDFELVISDNGSTDSTERICREGEARDSRVSYTRSEVNHGAAWNCNRVIWICWNALASWVLRTRCCCTANFLATPPRNGVGSDRPS